MKRAGIASITWACCLGLVLSCAVAGCRKPTDPVSPLPGAAPYGATRIEGAVVKGPVRGSRVRAYRLRADGSRGALLGEASTDSAGRFELNLIGAAGALRIEATGGDFVDEATSRVLALPEDKAVLCALVAKDAATKSIAVTPLTAMAASMAVERLRQGAVSGGDEGASIAAAIDASNRIVAGRYGLDDIADLDKAAARYAAVLAELSEEARRLATEAGQPLNVLDLTAALATDAADGTFDGKRDGMVIAIQGSTASLPAESADEPLPLPLPLPEPTPEPAPAEQSTFADRLESPLPPAPSALPPAPPEPPLPEPLPAIAAPPQFEIKGIETPRGRSFTGAESPEGAFVDLGSGAFRFALRVLPVLPARGDVAPDFVLHYHSRATVGAAGSGVFGTSPFTMSCFQSLARLPEGGFRLQNADGRQDLFDIDLGNGRWTARGRYAVLAEDPDTKAMVIREQSGITTRFFPFPESGAGCSALESIEDAQGNRIVFAYDKQGRLDTLEDVLGRAYFLEYDEEGRLSRLAEDPDELPGREVRLRYDARGRLILVVTPGDASYAFAYGDDSARIAKVRYPKDLRSGSDAPRIYNRYESSGPFEGRLIAQTLAGYATTSYAWTTLDGADKDGAFLTLATTDPSGRKAVHRFDALGRELSRTRGSSTTTTRYNADGEALAIVRPAGNRVELEYDTANANRLAQGDLIEVRAIADEARGRDSSGSPAEAIVTRFEYEPRFQRPARITSPTGAITDFAHGKLLRRDFENRGGANFAREAANPWLTTTWSFDALDRVIEESREVSEGVFASTRHEYEPSGRLAKLIDPTDRVIRKLDLDERGFVRSVSMGEGDEAPVYRYDYDANGNPTVVVDAGGRSWKTSFDGFDRPILAIDPLGNKTSTHFDAEGRVVAVVRSNADGERLAETRAVYDALSRPVRQEQDLFERPGQPTQAVVTTKLAWDLASRRIALTDPRGHTWTADYDGLGRVFRTSSPKVPGSGDWDFAPIETLFDYDPAGNILRQTQIDRDESGREEHAETEYRYDALGRVVMAVSALGNTERFVYDSRGKLTTHFDANGPLVPETTQDSKHKLNAPGHPTFLEYDGLGRLLMTRRGSIDPIVTRTSWDLAGRLLAQTDANGHATRRDYDALGRLAKELRPDGTEHAWSYDASGLVRESRDPNGTAVQSSRDALGRVIEERIARGPGVEGSTRTSFEYDALGRLIVATDDNGFATGDSVIERAYDSLGRVLAETQTQRDDAGQPASFTVGYAHDAAGNVLATRYPSGRTITRAFDDLNRQVLLQEGPGTTPPSKSPLDPVVPAPDLDGTLRIASWTHVGSRVRTRTYATPDPAGYAKAPVTLTVGYETAPGGCGGCGHALGNVRSMRYTQGAAAPGSLDAIELLALGYTYDREGRRSSESIEFAPYPGLSVYKAFVHDPNGRLTEEVRRPRPIGLLDNVAEAPLVPPPAAPTAADYVSENLVYAIDAAQNVTKRTDAMVVRNWDSAPLAYTQQAFDYEVDASNALAARLFSGGYRDPIGRDAMGNRAMSGGAAYDYKNRLVRLGAERYRYDAEDRRIRRRILEKPLNEIHLYDQSFQVLEERTDASSIGQGHPLKRQEVWASSGPCPGDELLELKDDADKDGIFGEDRETLQPLANAQNSVMALVDATGAMRFIADSEPFLKEFRLHWRRDYKAYGESGWVEANRHKEPYGRAYAPGLDLGLEAAEAAAVWDFPYGFQGQRHDKETGLYYFRHRYYDPATARFLSPDPLGAWGDPLNLGNAYAFPGVDPVTFTDPTGQFGFAGAIVGAIGGAAVGGVVAWWKGDSVLAGMGKGALIGAVGGATMGLGLAAGTGLATVAGASTTVATTAGVLTGGTLAGAAEGAAAHLLGETGDLTLGESMALGAGTGLVTAGLVHGGTSYAQSVGSGIRKAVGEGVEEGLERGLGQAAISNPIPDRMARVVPAAFADGPTLAAPSASEAWVTAAKDLKGISTAEGVATRLGLVDEAGQFIPGARAVIEFDAVTEEIASPVFRITPGFVGCGRTSGNAREFVIRNLKISSLTNVTIRIVRWTKPN